MEVNLLKGSPYCQTSYSLCGKHKNFSQRLKNLSCILEKNKQPYELTNILSR